MLNPQLESHIQRLEGCCDENEYGILTVEQPELETLASTVKTLPARRGLLNPNWISKKWVAVGILSALVHQVLPLALARALLLFLLAVDLIVTVGVRRPIQQLPDAKIFELRKRLSALMASVGAPLLEVPLTAPPSGGTPSARQLELVEQCVETVVVWLRTVDLALRLLDVGASARLSLGIDSRAVRRMERTAIAKALRNGHHSFQGNFVTQPVQRRRLFQSMKQINETMLRVCYPSEGQATLTTDEGIITLRLLNSLRTESGEIVSELGGRLTTTSLLTESEFSTVQALQFAAAEAKEYLVSSFALGSRQQMHAMRPRWDLAIGRIQKSIDYAQELLCAVQNLLMHEDLSLRETSIHLTKMWIELVAVSSMLHSETLDAQATFTPEETGENGARSDDVEVFPNKPAEQEREYVVEIYSPAHREDSTRPLQASNVMIFSGRGSLKSREVKAATHSSAWTVDSVQRRLLDSECLLVQELQKHLEAMPQLDDLRTTVEPCDDDEEEVALSCRLDTASLSAGTSASAQVLTELAHCSCLS